MESLKHLPQLKIEPDFFLINSIVCDKETISVNERRGNSFDACSTFEVFSTKFLNLLLLCFSAYKPGTMIGIISSSYFVQRTGTPGQNY